MSKKDILLNVIFILIFFVSMVYGENVYFRVINGVALVACSLSVYFRIRNK